MGLAKGEYLTSAHYTRISPFLQKKTAPWLHYTLQQGTVRANLQACSGKIWEVWEYLLFNLLVGYRLEEIK